MLFLSRSCLLSSETGEVGSPGCLDSTKNKAQQSGCGTQANPIYGILLESMLFSIFQSRRCSYQAVDMIFSCYWYFTIAILFSPSFSSTNFNDAPPFDFDYYEALELSRASATPKEINRQYKRLAMQFHPDKNKNNNCQNCHEKFHRITTAYQGNRAKQTFR